MVYWVKDYVHAQLRPFVYNPIVHGSQRPVILELNAMNCSDFPVDKAGGTPHLFQTLPYFTDTSV